MNAGRKNTPAAASKELVIDVDAVNSDFKTSSELALVNAQHESAVRAMADRVGYQLDVVDPDLIQRDIASNMRRSVEACMELGRGLCVLKTACGHGNFEARLQVLQLDHDLAKRLMQAAVKFSKGASTRLLGAVNSQTKLLELLVLDDERIEEFELVGQSGELSLDDVASMSVKDLRAALRKERQEAAKQKSRAERQESVNAELHEEVKMISRLKPEEATKRTQAEASNIQADTVGLIKGSLRQALIALNNCDSDQQLFMAGMVGQVMAELVMLRDEFSLPEVGGKPEWERWAEAQDTATAPAKAN